MKKLRNSLYWKISATLFLLLVVIGVVYGLIMSYTAQNYLQEVNQRLYGALADSTVNVVKPMVEGEVDTTAIQDIMHSTMVINPSAEVYLLDTTGAIITFMAPYKKIKLKSVDLEPIKTFINSTEKPFIKGEDPRHPGELKVFSAAPIREEDYLAGYLYIILASEEQAAVTSALFGSYFLDLGTRMFIISLIGALAIGLLALWFLTRNLRRIVKTVVRFKEGDYQARIENRGQGELTSLSNTFNEMADTIVANIEELKSVENLRRELIANVSHDLRTPLAIMQGYVETLQIKEETLSKEERQHYLNIILNSSEKLSKLIRQLFEYSKLEAKQIVPQKEPFFMAELAQDVLQKYQILAKEKRIHLELEAPPELPLVFADISLVERVLQNLLDNALKFTPEEGTVTMILQEGRKNVEVKIADTGPG
ncbi:MAG: HAMP domain-containing histidine kinase, partial [Phaeodactylibacter sp.]|nr:HAMP domain-containing histidine kinase [Phaeodactylibacter sp.]